MPIHDFQCPKGHKFELYQPIDGLEEFSLCACGELAQKVFLSFPFAIVSEEIHYTSPIDGRVIRTKQERLDDLARSNCVPWEPGIAQDGERIKQAQEASLDRAVDETVEREYEKLDGDQRSKLAKELLTTDIEVVRTTAGG